MQADFKGIAVQSLDGVLCRARHDLDSDNYALAGLMDPTLIHAVYYIPFLFSATDIRDKGEALFQNCPCSGAGYLGRVAFQVSRKIFRLMSRQPGAPLTDNVVGKYGFKLVFRNINADQVAFFQ